MDPRISWTQPENVCRALDTWNRCWELSNSIKWTSEKNSHEPSPFPSPVLNQQVFPQNQEVFEPVHINPTVVHNEQMLEGAQIFHDVGENVTVLRDGTPNQFIRYPVKIEPNANILCPLYITEMQETRVVTSNNRHRKQREDIENKRKLNKASVYGRFIEDKTLSDKNEKALPWKQSSKPYSRGIYGLHEEMKDFQRYISPTPAEHRMREMVIKRIEDIVKELWPSAQVDVFGSFRTHLYLPTSDIDLVIFGKWDNLPLRELEGALKRKGIAHDIKVLDRALVPIVKMTDNDTDIRVDIGFNIANSVKSADLIIKFIEEFPCLPSLVFVVKQYLLQRNLNEVWNGGISSYCLILMCVSFLQLHPRIRPCDSSVNNLGSLLIEFFELYGRHFNYFQTGIRITDGGSYVKKTEIQKEMIGDLRASFLCIEDPLTPGNDIGRSSYGALLVKQAFEYAFITLNSALMPQNSWLNARNESILSRIIHVTDDVIVYRRRINERFQLSSITSESNDSENDESWISAGQQEDSAAVK